MPMAFCISLIVSFPADDSNGLRIEGTICDSEMNKLGIGKFIVLFDWFIHGGFQKVSPELAFRRDQKAHRMFVAPSE
jgi:hypothetical protein